MITSLPGVPEERSIDAFVRVRGLYQTDFNSRSKNWSSMFGRATKPVKILQDYTYQPIPNNWSMVLDLWRHMRVKKYILVTPETTSAFSPEQHYLEYTKSNGRISTHDEFRLKALVQVATILGIAFSSSNYRDLYGTPDPSDPTVRAGNFWGREFFQYGSTELMLKKIYRGRSP